MAQAKGVLPTKGDDREVLYRNPRACGYFVGAKLAAGLTGDQISTWLTAVDSAVDALVVRADPEPGAVKGEKLASVAVGFARSFFDRLDAAAVGLERPTGFTADAAPLADTFAGISAADVEVMFYVTAVAEARVNTFLAALGAMPEVAALSLRRGYQRIDGTEPFGYADGLRNVRSVDRPRVVFVHTDGGQPDEPAWADGGTYLATLTIVQDLVAFASLPDDTTRDAVIGRTKDGTRLDLVGRGVKPHDEPADEPDALPATSHVRKAGPRGVNDANEIFRRGMPFVDVVDGKVRVGLLFASFQATPAQFDTAFNEWMRNPRFPRRPDGTAVGADALLMTTPAGPLVTMSDAGLFFVPPSNPGGLAATLGQPAKPGKPRIGHIVVNKVIVHPGDPVERMDRSGFKFEVRSPGGVTVPDSVFVTGPNGRGVCGADLDIGSSYQLVEVESPRVDVAVREPLPFTMDKPNKLIRVENTTAAPPSVY